VTDMQHDKRSSSWRPQVSDDDYIRFLRGESVLGLSQPPETDPEPEPSPRRLGVGRRPGQHGTARRARGRNAPPAGPNPRRPAEPDPSAEHRHQVPGRHAAAPEPVLPPEPPPWSEPPRLPAAPQTPAVAHVPAVPHDPAVEPDRRTEAPSWSSYDEATTYFAQSFGTTDDPLEGPTVQFARPAIPPDDEPPAGSGARTADGHEPPWQPRAARRAEAARAGRAAQPLGLRRPRWLQVVGWTGVLLGLLVMALGGYGYYEYRKISGNIKRVDVLATNDPSIKNREQQLDAENFLLIGSDTRAGANNKYGGPAVIGQRSDTTILAHLSPDRQHATLISFPRDSWVTIPACAGGDGATIPQHDGMFNSAFESGGPQCTILTLQRLTGVEINHYVQVDFTGFKTMVDALGGVPICSTEKVSDHDSGLKLRVGPQTLVGEQALAFVRARHALGDGSDIDRIKRQQQFLGSMIRVATGRGILLNPVRLTRFLDAASRSVTLDRRTSLGDLRNLASQLHGLDPRKVTFLTAPIANRDYDPTGQRATGGGRVLLDAAQGEVLWQSLINDRPAARASSAPGGSAAHGPTTATVTVPPEQVSVRVLNGVGTPGLASRVASALGGGGFAIASTGNGPSRGTASLIRYGPAGTAQAVTLAAAVPGSVLVRDMSLDQSLELVVGSSYQGVRPVRLGQWVATRTGTAPAAGPAARTPSPQPPINAGQASCV